MIRVESIFVWLCLLVSVPVWGQNAIGLRASAALRGIQVGTAVVVDYIREKADFNEYANKIQRDATIIVTENDFKPKRIWLGDGKYNWNNTDFLVGSTANSTGWAQQNLMAVRGHTLIWPDDSFTPKWLLDQESSITSEKARLLLTDYIHAVVSRYRGKILVWDVVNEALNSTNTSNPLNLRDSFWLRKLGPDYLKIAFSTARAADPNAKLYYNDFGIESTGLKTTRTIDLIKWVRSQGATVHGVGMQWHIDSSRSVTPGDGHYQSAQQFINNQLYISVTELDISIPTDGGYLIDRSDLYKQAALYRAVLNYAIHFYPKCEAFLTWGFTDRYSWLPDYHKYKKGAGLPLDWMYRPKPAYLEMQELMTRVVIDGVYRLSPQLQPDKCLGAGMSNNVQLYGGSCDDNNKRWNITWLGDGSYRFSLLSNPNLVLAGHNVSASRGYLQTNYWTNYISQRWAFSAKGNSTFRIVPYTAWWKVMTLDDTSDVSVVSYASGKSQHWILTKV
ncbi:unnamed protein product [Adineta ricciae]|uniref:endo-1,4-beta-xylanase n=1 Tax=Adineta ricciae TaxID=249248 RepID=A0A815L7B9_ADIRI|nr:unnamed protein product [Adineta ricciae]CAF1400493.1 unnamed protein product [Adineta ricciae]